MNHKSNLSREAKRRAASLYRRLGSDHQGVRLAARESLAELGADVVPLLLKLVRRENAVRQVARWSAVLLLGTALLLLIAGMVKMITPPLDAWVTGLVLWGMIMGIVLFPPASRRHKEVLTVFTRLEDPRTVGLLIEALGLRHFEDADVRTIAAEALAGRLPRMTGEEYAVLTAQQRHLLRRELQRESVALVLAVLGLLCDYGGPMDLAWVRPLAESAGTTRGADVAEAARECLSRLQERVQREKDGRELLRTPKGGGYSSENLLRAAEGIMPLE
jgi:HEAT repeat protein